MDGERTWQQEEKDTPYGEPRIVERVTVFRLLRAWTLRNQASFSLSPFRVPKQRDFTSHGKPGTLLSPAEPSSHTTPMADAPTSTTQHFRLLPLGDAALTVEFGHEIDPAVNERVIAFAETVRTQRWEGVLDVVPTYRSVTIHVNPLCLDLNTLTDRLLQLPHTKSHHATSSVRHHAIPVLYGGECGPDLQDIATFAKMSIADVIRLHVSVLYRVYMLGFSPGFPYLGSVPEPLAMPRLATPRTMVPAGSVGIAGNQTGIYPTSTPGGWRLIGRTPVALYRPNSSTPFLLNPGDVVRFEPIEPQDFNRLRREHHDDAH